MICCDNVDRAARAARPNRYNIRSKVYTGLNTIETKQLQRRSAEWREGLRIVQLYCRPLRPSCIILGVGRYNMPALARETNFCNLLLCQLLPSGQSLWFFNIFFHILVLSADSDTQAQGLAIDFPSGIGHKIPISKTLSILTPDVDECQPIWPSVRLREPILWYLQRNGLAHLWSRRFSAFSFQFAQ